ncbi:uncharacterized protein LOC107268886 [Cephus cinctus]|uniref:Uncharacterized protein LOC107268886 n=1 Tax=Cephus cinctus TaxID=211228 RepID=A0AAJ7FLE5_CEPCN|nr:uncharacterized protein LOC107268886 [Cephus cinctus]
MARSRRLRLDEVVSSVPELGPSVPDGGYSWIILLGVVTIQMTVPSILSMYGVVMGYLESDIEPDIDLYTGKITMTPILFYAFWNLTDPWSRTIVSLASVPRLVALIGVMLLSIGVLASGYLATGGVGAYLARLSAGAVMGIGASIIIIQSENMLRRHFRTRLRLVLTLKNIAFALGQILAPGYAFLLLSKAGLQTGLFLMAIIFIPTALGAATFAPPALQYAAPYTLLLGEEDNELTIKDTSPDVTRGTQHETEAGQTDASIRALEQGQRPEQEPETAEGPPPLFGAGSNSFSYEDPEDDVSLFVTPIARVSTTWSDEFRTMKLVTFWFAVFAWTGLKIGPLSICLLLPLLTIVRVNSATLADGVIVLIVLGVGTLIPAIGSYWNLKTAHQRSVYFGLSCWLGGFVLPWPTV